MNEKRISAVFVLDDGKPVGLVRIHDILHWGIT
jgi:CBS domain-containing protein